MGCCVQSDGGAYICYTDADTGNTKCAWFNGSVTEVRARQGTEVYPVGCFCAITGVPGWQCGTGANVRVALVHIPLSGPEEILSERDPQQYASATTNYICYPGMGMPGFYLPHTGLTMHYNVKMVYIPTDSTAYYNKTYNESPVINIISVPCSACLNAVQEEKHIATFVGCNTNKTGDFTYTANGLTVTFNDTTTCSPSGWWWDFGDNSAKAWTKSPTHTFPAAGSYIVSDMAQFPDGTSITTKKTVLVNITPACTSWNASIGKTINSCVVNFTGTASCSPSGCSPCSISSHYWTFGDGTTSTSQNPTKVYSASGIYTVTYKATFSDGHSATTSTSVSVSCTTICMGADADFTWKSKNLTVTFTNTSKCSTSWSWNFGDGTTSTVKNPTKVYNKAGSYTVVLTGTMGGSTTTKTKIVTIRQGRVYSGAVGDDEGYEEIVEEPVNGLVIVGGIALGLGALYLILRRK